MADKEWLAGLKVGDQIMAPPGRSWGSSTDYRLMKITRETKAFFFCHVETSGTGYEIQIRKEDGKLHGQYGDFIRAVTDADLRYIERKKLRNRIDHHWRAGTFLKLPADKLQAILAIIEPEKSKI